MSAFGDFQVPLIGDVHRSETEPGYIDRLLKRALPEARRRLAAMCYTGRPRKLTVTEAAWVTDLAELRQNILLCGTCDPKFEPSHRRYGYFPDNRWRTQTGGVLGVCDGCRANMAGLLQLYVHESYIGMGPGHSYLPL